MNTKNISNTYTHGAYFHREGAGSEIEDDGVVSERLALDWVDIPKIASISFITEK